MERLTTDNPQNNTETMLNYAYAKDGRVFLRYGDQEDDIDLCEYMARMCRIKNCDPTAEEVMENGLECECSLSILYTVAVQAAELRSRLSAFEDLGMSPDAITKMGMMFEDSKRYSARLEGRLKAYKATGDEKRMQELQDEAYDLGYQSCLNYKGLKWSEAEELQRYREAKADGRLMILPVKEGTKVFRICHKLDGKHEIEGRYFSLTYNRPEDFGKSLFTTREEAEAALKGAGNG